MIRRRTLAVLAALVIAAAPAVTFELAGRPLDDDRYTLLVMGSDQGPWRSGTVLQGRADAMHLISVVPSKNAASILSFPRDAYVPVPGMGTTRINASLTRGPDTAVATVSELTGLEIDDWVVTGMGSFHFGVSAFGGVEIPVLQRLQIDDNVLEPGRQRLDGPNALLYARDRKNRSDGDFGRNRAQAELLAAMHGELVARHPPPLELAGLVTEFRRNTVSSIPAARMPILAKVALDIDPDLVRRKQAPGRNAMRGSAAVVVLTDRASSLYADLRDDGLFEP